MKPEEAVVGRKVRGGIAFGGLIGTIVSINEWDIVRVEVDGCQFSYLLSGLELVVEPDNSPLPLPG